MPPFIAFVPEELGPPPAMIWSSTLCNASSLPSFGYSFAAIADRAVSNSENVILRLPLALTFAKMRSTSVVVKRLFFLCTSRVSLQSLAKVLLSITLAPVLPPKAQNRRNTCCTDSAGGGASPSSSFTSPPALRARRALPCLRALSLLKYVTKCSKSMPSPWPPAASYSLCTSAVSKPKSASSAVNSASSMVLDLFVSYLAKAARASASRASARATAASTAALPACLGTSAKRAACAPV
mmetsp:Transcript_46558/g.94877  ORF Transcript_46558/g.94877 Transcript_46558/m.94877 type:complete len:239 (+) Transcript_46558:277-993(+)